MIDLAMLGLIRADIQQQISHTALPLGHVPVSDRDLGGLEGLPLGQFAGVDVVDGEGVGEHGLLFEVADEAVAGAGRDEVGEEEAVEEDALGAEDHEAHKGARLGHFEEGEEVHALVVGFFEEGFDPVRGGLSEWFEEMGGGERVTSRCHVSFAGDCGGGGACLRPFLVRRRRFLGRRSGQAISVRSWRTRLAGWMASGHFGRL